MSKIADCPAERATYFFGGKWKIRILFNLFNKKKVIEVPICCDEGFELDLKVLEEKLKINKKQILKDFFKNEYFCYMTGFIAGMPFMGDLNVSLRSNRLKTPRVKVPKGSVGITEQFCNIYTFESPGGWHIIGKTPLQIFDKQNTKQQGLSLDEHFKTGGLHAVGRYQFIGSTLQDEVSRMGLSKDTKFTPEVQDQIFLSHLKRVGNISPWVGPSTQYSPEKIAELNSLIATI